MAHAEIAPRTGAARLAGIATLGMSVLADSALEHWRGSFANPGMGTSLLSSLTTTAAGASGAAGNEQGRPRAGGRK